MGLGCICCFVEKSDRIVLASWIVLGGSYIWIWIVSAGSYRWIYLYMDRIGCIGWIGSAELDWIIMAGWGHIVLCIGWLLQGWDGWTWWGVGGTGVRRTNVSRRRNGSATMGAGTGAPLLALEGSALCEVGSWHQFRRCCKNTDYLFRRSKKIQIECTQIRTSNVVQDSIKRTYDTIVLWLHTTIDCMYNAIVPK